MKTIDNRLLNGLVFVGTVLLGLLLLPTRLFARVLAVGAAVIALVLAGVFIPTFSMQILNGVLFSAVFVVAVMWAVGFAASIHKNWKSMPFGPVPVSEHGVDLAKYQPELPVLDPPAAASMPSDAPKPDGQEGGQSNA
jgi:hypothetical protein